MTPCFDCPGECNCQNCPYCDIALTSAFRKLRVDLAKTCAKIEKVETKQ